MRIGSNKADTATKLPAFIVVCRSVAAHFIRCRKVRIGTVQDIQTFLTGKSCQCRTKANRHEFDKADVNGHVLRNLAKFKI